MLLDRFRAAGRPVVHVQHSDGAGTPYDISAPIGAIADVVAPRDGEPVVIKAYPSSFEQTNLQEVLKAAGVTELTIAGFMTHMCVNSTTRVAFNLGYKNTVVAAATATRALPSPVGGDAVPASVLQSATLAGLADLFAVVVPSQQDLPAA